MGFFLDQIAASGIPNPQYVHPRCIRLEIDEIAAIPAIRSSQLSRSTGSLERSAPPSPPSVTPSSPPHARADDLGEQYSHNIHFKDIIVKPEYFLPNLAVSNFINEIVIVQDRSIRLTGNLCWRKGSFRSLPFFFTLFLNSSFRDEEVGEMMLMAFDEQMRIEEVISLRRNNLRFSLNMSRRRFELFGRSNQVMRSEWRA